MIQISWLLQRPTDLDLHCLQRKCISGFSRTRVILSPFFDSFSNSLNMLQLSPTQYSLEQTTCILTLLTLLTLQYSHFSSTATTIQDMPSTERFPHIHCYDRALLPSIICLGRLRIASKYIFNLSQLRQGVDSLAQWLEHWIFNREDRVRIPREV